MLHFTGIPLRTEKLRSVRQIVQPVLTQRRQDAKTQRKIMQSMMIKIFAPSRLCVLALNDDLDDEGFAEVARLFFD